VTKNDEFIETQSKSRERTVTADVGNRAQGLYLTDVLQNGISVFDSGFDARADAAPVQVVLNPDGATVRGSIQDPAGKSLPNGIVALVPAEDRRQNRALYRSAVTDANGRFTLLSIAPDQYKLFAWGPGLHDQCRASRNNGRRTCSGAPRLALQG